MYHKSNYLKHRYFESSEKHFQISGKILEFVETKIIRQATKDDLEKYKYTLKLEGLQSQKQAYAILYTYGKTIAEIGDTITGIAKKSDAMTDSLPVYAFNEYQITKY